VGTPDVTVMLAASLPAPASSNSIAVRAFREGDAACWDEFVTRHPQGSFFQLTGWKRVIEKTFGYRPCYFLAERAGEITGIAPLFSISNWLIGNCLMSVPLGVYAGICAADEKSRESLLDLAKNESVLRGVDYLELRNRNGPIDRGFHHNSLYTTFTTSLEPNFDTNLKRLPRDTRYMIRKGEKAGLRIERGNHQLDAFYRLFAQSMHRHGTPVFPHALFANLEAEFGPAMDVMMVYRGSEAVSGVISFFFRDAVLPYYAGAGPDATKTAANNFMYWELMKYAVQRGCRTFDFGRSKKGTGSYAFKTQWNMTAELLNYEVFLVRRKTIPNFSPVNSKFERATRVWRRLPLWMANAMGPHVVRWLP
jgi:FemAB-related protein (PEP-CTERM system-associated)